ncbi:phage antirepressor KilAC domain-containing protein [Marinobacter sp. NFXS9]|uniref:phage antirepressor KilAC domain-containing protein n=1 Tax=Marinobacter sp. NFXS9 TaxID=2818433 RepID=UPI0032DEB50B
MEYTFDQAAGLLNIGRNTLTRQLREQGMLCRYNLPTGRWRGSDVFRVVMSSYRHPTLGNRPYGRTLITNTGLDVIAAKIGARPVRLNSDDLPVAWVN